MKERLVRDRVAERMRAEGISVRFVEGDEAKHFLADKLKEECLEAYEVARQVVLGQNTNIRSGRKWSRV